MYVWIPILGAGAFDAFPQALNIWDNWCVPYWVFSWRWSMFGCKLPLEILVSCDLLPTWLVPLSSQLPFITLFCTLFMANLGYLHLTRASLRWCTTPHLKSPSVVHTVLALWVSVPMTLYLTERLWWLSHCKYWSVWVGLWYTFMLRELTASGLTKVPRKEIVPFSWLPLTCELYTWINTIHMIQKKFLISLLLDDPSVIHKPVP